MPSCATAVWPSASATTWARTDRPRRRGIDRNHGRTTGFKAIKLRQGRPTLKEELATIAAVRRAVGEDIELMRDFNQGLSLGEAL